MTNVCWRFAWPVLRTISTCNANIKLQPRAMPNHSQLFIIVHAPSPPPALSLIQTKMQFHLQNCVFNMADN